MIVDEPIAEVSREHLQSIISRFKTSKKVNTNYQRIEENAAKAKRLKYAEKDPLDDLRVVNIMPPEGNVTQSGDELRGDHPVHGSTNGGNYVINVSKNVWHCKRCESGGGPALAIAVKHGLISCSDAQAGEPRGDLFKQVLKIAIEKYGMDGNGAAAKRSALEAALLFMADRCDGAHSTDGQGFNRDDTVFGKAMAEKVRSGQSLTPQEYKEVHKMLRLYNKNQLAPAGMDMRLIPKEPPKDSNGQQEKEIIPPSPKAIEAARKTLENEKPIEAHLSYVNGKIQGGEKPARAIILAGYSAYLSADDRLHADAVGSAQSGKSATVTAVLETFPEENVIVTSEASPKSLYYLAQESPERLKDTIVYIDDARPEHIPVLKTFRNEGNVTPRNLTVSDGEVLELIVQYRPVVLASSVTPLRDLEQQATSRTFLISIPDATPDEEKKVRTAIRRQARIGAILSQRADDQLKTLRAMAGILRDEGLRDVLVPFDAIEPLGADRRGTGQFMRLIKISAFINQFQRPILELTDGRKFVLAIYDDLTTATEVWFDFAEGQEFKISAKALEVLHSIPSTWPGKTAPMLSKDMGKGQRTIERYLEDLYESGIVSRERITAPGMPWGYWCELEMRQKVLSQIPESEDDKQNSVRITTKNLCRKYLEEKSSDSLKDSYISFFSNSDIIKKEMYRGIKAGGDLLEGSAEKIYSFLFSPKSCRYSQKEAIDSEKMATDEMSLFVANPLDSGSENVANPTKNVVIPSEAKSKTIKADLLQAEEERKAREEHFKTPTTKKSDLDALVTVQFKTDYQTDVQGEMRHFHEGDTLAVSLGRAKAWAKCGVAEVVEASAA